jgi:zinc transport system substrate-binding protein
MKQLIIQLFILMMTLIVLSGCNSSDTANKDKPLIITTIYPYELIVRELVDTLFTVETLLPPNASPHTWSPGPKDIMKLEKADVIVSNGLVLEINLDKILTSYSKKNIVAAGFLNNRQYLSENSDSILFNNGSNDPETVDKNPHIWTSPDCLTSIILGLDVELSKRYPMLKSSFDSRARQMIMEVNRVSGKIMTEIALIKQPSIVTLHDAFKYFFDFFHIRYIGSIEQFAGNEPSPRRLKYIADDLKKYKLKAIFIEPRMNPKPAEILANEMGLKVLTYDDLGTTLSAKTIADFLWLNWLAIKPGL